MCCLFSISDLWQDRKVLSLSLPEFRRLWGPPLHHLLWNIAVLFQDCPSILFGMYTGKQTWRWTGLLPTLLTIWMKFYGPSREISRRPYVIFFFLIFWLIFILELFVEYIDLQKKKKKSPTGSRVFFREWAFFRFSPKGHFDTRALCGSKEST